MKMLSRRMDNNGAAFRFSILFLTGLFAGTVCSANAICLDAQKDTPAVSAAGAGEIHATWDQVAGDESHEIVPADSGAGNDDPEPGEERNFSASDGTYCQKIRLTWDRITGDTGVYEIGRQDNGSGNSDYTVIASVSGTTHYDDFDSHDPARTYSYSIKDSGGSGNSEEYATGAVQCGPDLKVNDEDGPVVLPRGSRVIITLHINPQNSDLGAMQDWWVVAYTSWGWYNYAWYYIPDLAYIQPAYQGGLGFISSRTLLDTTHLSPGTYTIYFGIDPCDGQLSLSDVQYDYVTFIIDG